MVIERIVDTSGKESNDGVLAELRYLDRGGIRITGPVTRTQYEFSVTAPVQSVDIRDAAVLLRTRYFKPA